MKISIVIIFSFCLLSLAKAQQQKQEPMQKSYTKDSVNSRDGTVIGYRQVGQGAGIILLHGTFESAKSHAELAEILADSFTVYLPDRRCRGMSPYADAHYDIQKDIEDLDALLQKTGAHFIFAVSSGAIVVLNAALVLSSIKKIALYEPPMKVDSAKLMKAMKRYDREVAENKTANAMVTVMLEGKFGPKIFKFLPRFILRGFTNKMMKGEERAAASNDVTMRMLAPTLHHDLQIIAENMNKFDKYRDVKVETLLLGGSKSPKYFSESLDALTNVLPNKKRIVFQGLDHGGSGSSEWGGNPRLIARELLQFFGVQVISAP